MHQDCLATNLQAQILVEDDVRNCCRDSFADDWLERALVGDDLRPGVLQQLCTADVIRVSMGIDNVCHADVEAPLHLIGKPTRRAGHRRVNYDGAFARDQDQATVHSESRTGGMAVKIASQLNQCARVGRAVRRRHVWL